MSQFFIGQQLKIQGTFRNLAGALTNPSGITLRIMKPDGTLESTVTESGMTNASTGVWYYLYTPDASGRYYFRMVSAGIVAAHEDEFDVAVSVF